MEAVIGGEEGWHNYISLTIPEHPDAIKYGGVFQALAKAKPGDIAKVTLDGRQFYMAMFPKEPPSQRQAVFLRDIQ